MIYLDNASTSFPKPGSVAAGIAKFLNEIGANPGRSGHRLSAESARIVFEAREKLAELFHAPDSGRIVFAANATTALNTAILSLGTEDAHIITSGMEHNSVIRPLRFLEVSNRISLSFLHCSPEGEIDPADIRKKIRRNTRLIVVQHASNVTGTLQPLRDIVRAAGEIPVLVDAAQTAGSFPIDVQKEHVALLAFTGHKALLGPTGTGGLFIRDDIALKPLIRGGTGSRSESEEQPDFLPDALEAGTINVVGVAGLLEAVDFVLKTGVETIRKHEMDLTMHFLKKLEKIERVETYGPDKRDRRLATVSLNIRGVSPSELSYALDREYEILTRPGLHCAPHAHRTLRTFPTGTVRFSFGYFNTAADVDAAVEALKVLAWPPDAA